MASKPMTDPMELVGRLENFDGGHQKDAYELIDEAAACIREMVEWRPIETAPSKERVSVLLIGRYPGGAGWSDVYHCWSQPPFRDDWATHWARWPHAFPPTHWLPLPPAPGAEA